MGRQGVDKEYDATKVLKAHECGDLRITTERAGGTCRAVLDFRVVFAPESLAHPAVDCTRGCDQELLDKFESGVMSLPLSHLIVVFVPVILNFFKTSEYVSINSFIAGFM